MRLKQLTESELFRKLNILVLDRHKTQLDNLKEKVSLLGNLEMDNSCFLRGVIEYFDEHPEELKKLLPYVKKTKGYHILFAFQKMVKNNQTSQEIEKLLGVGVEITEKMREKYQL